MRAGGSRLGPGLEVQEKPPACSLVSDCEPALLEGMAGLEGARGVDLVGADRSAPRVGASDTAPTAMGRSPGSFLYSGQPAPLPIPCFGCRLGRQPRAAISDERSMREELQAEHAGSGRVRAMTETIRDFRPGRDDAEVGDLWRRVFGEAKGGQTVEWLFRPGQAGNSPRSVVEIDGRIVAHAGATAIRFRVAGEDVRGAYSVGAMTDPAFRGRGLWARLGQHLYARLEREGFAFVAGFSNENSHRLMTGPLGRTPIRPFPWCVRLVSPLALVRSLAGRPVPCGPVSPPVVEQGSVRICAAEPGDLRLDAIWKRAADASSVGCIRDAAFSFWRFASRPEAGYRLLLAERDGEPAGFGVYRTLELRGIRAGFVLDLVLAAGEKAAGALLLRSLVALARAEGAGVLSALLPGSGPSRSALRRAGFVRVPERFHPQLIRFSVRGLGPFSRSRLLVDPNAWHLSWADTDVV